MPRTTQQHADELLAENLAVGKTVVAAARAAGVSERTAYRRLKEPAVRARITEVRRAALDAVAGRLTHGMVAACDHLTGLVGHDNPHVQIRAAKTVLQLALQVRRAVDVEDRLAQLQEPPRMPPVSPVLANVDPRPVALGPRDGPVDRSDHPGRDGAVDSPTEGGMPPGAHAPATGGECERNVCGESHAGEPTPAAIRSPAPDEPGRPVRVSSPDPGTGAYQSGRSALRGVVVLGLLVAAGLSFAATAMAHTHPGSETGHRTQTCQNLPEPATRSTFAPAPGQHGGRLAGHSLPRARDFAARRMPDDPHPGGPRQWAGHGCGTAGRSPEPNSRWQDVIPTVPVPAPGEILFHTATSLTRSGTPAVRWGRRSSTTPSGRDLCSPEHKLPPTTALPT